MQHPDTKGRLLSPHAGEREGRARECAHFCRRSMVCCSPRRSEATSVSCLRMYLEELRCCSSSSRTDACRRAHSHHRLRRGDRTAFICDHRPAEWRPARAAWLPRRRPAERRHSAHAQMGQGTRTPSCSLRCSGGRAPFRSPSPSWRLRAGLNVGATRRHPHASCDCSCSSTAWKLAFSCVPQRVFYTVAS
jgi:hypothetical protein